MLIVMETVYVFSMHSVLKCFSLHCTPGSVDWCSPKLHLCCVFSQVAGGVVFEGGLPNEYVYL